jgi:protein-tyrosine phosphatase
MSASFPLDPPFLHIDGVRNFRDFGGYATQNGERVIRGHLFRSANYAEITTRGLAQFDATGIRLVVDLRRGPERVNSPSQLPSDLGGRSLETMFSSHGYDEGNVLAPHLQFIQAGNLSVESCHDHMMSSYRRIPWEAQYLEIFKQTFDRLAYGQGPIVIHCAAGKDRTGILCGLILHTLGVSQSDIAHDYLLTNAVPLDTPWLEGYAQRMSDMFDRQIDPLTLLPLLGVHADFLDQAWSEMDRRDGGLDGYLAKLGVSKAMVTAIKAKLLVS